MVHRFNCTACGKCCYGQVPLTVNDAFSHANRFPLAMVWTPLRQVSKDFDMVAHLGTTIPLNNRKVLAVLIVPTAYIPPNFPCPALTEDNLCSIQTNKPSRCRTMPFYPYRDEQYQAELLVPRPGWTCDTSEAAPIVFQDKKIVFRGDFDLERRDLENQRTMIRRYADYMLKYTPQLVENLVRVATKHKAGQVVTSLSSFLTAIRHLDAKQIAQQQLPVLNNYAEKTAEQHELVDFHQSYSNWAKEMKYLAQRSPIENRDIV